MAQLRTKSREGTTTILVRDDFARVSSSKPGRLILTYLGGKYGDKHYELELSFDEIAQLLTRMREAKGAT